MYKEYKSFLQYLETLIVEIGNVVTNSKKYSNEEIFINISKIIMKPEYRIHLGVLIIIASMFLYILDVSNY